MESIPVLTSFTKPSARTSMGIIQVRLNQSQFQKRMSEFLGKQINIVFADSTTSFGYLEKIRADTIVMRNMRLAKTTHLISDINEVYFDKKF